jgi:hypothetical protein
MQVINGRSPANGIVSDSKIIRELLYLGKDFEDV